MDKVEGVVFATIIVSMFLVGFGVFLAAQREDTQRYQVCMTKVVDFHDKLLCSHIIKP
jgi:hypothetical protein